MVKSSISKEKYIIMRDRACLLNPVYWNCIVQSSLEVKNIYGINSEQVLMKFYKKNNEFFQTSLYKKKNFESIGEYITKKLIEDKKYFLQISRKAEIKKKEIIELLKIIEKLDLGKLNFKELLRRVNEIKKFWIDYDVCTTQAWFSAGDTFKEAVRKKLNLPEDDFIFLSDPLEKTQASKFEEVLMKSILQAKKYEHKIKIIAKELSRNFGWIPFGYDGPEYWDTDYFILKLQEGLGLKEKVLITKINEVKRREREIAKKYSKLIKKYEFNQEEQRLISIMQTLTIWTDERKALDYRLNYHYARILKELEKRYDIPFLNLKFLFLEELPGVVDNREEILKKTNERLAKPFVIEYKNGEGGIVSRRKAEKIINFLDSQVVEDELKGLVACKGEKNNYQGRVKILFSPKEISKVEEGDFLIASMTTPDYILAMRKSAGFITDEGGVTCHAAIVAREMNKPCIIGTKNATRFLKDGDEIEMDMSTGMIRKLN